ncbi:MAG: hypothetical protein A2Y66_02485 [Nitrospirae bacterium RBG_13_41_22]|nr:MAG: hypothetical protein A2Y66_02485 [Nitrospirae bacterium RBG_13_41_22]
MLEKIIELFVNRKDAYAIQNKNGSYFKVEHPITEEVIKKHLNHEYTLGFYQLNKDNKVKYICFDFDGDDLEEQFNLAKTFYLKLKGEDKLSPLMEFSGKKGFHIWIFCEEVDAYSARKYAKEISNGVEVHEIFPKQDTINFDGYGNLIKLPLGKHQVSGYNSYFFDLDDLEKRLTIQDDSIKLLERIKKIVVPHFEKTKEEEFIEKDIDIKEIIKEPLFDALINKGLPQGQIYDVLIKNAAIFMANSGIGTNSARGVFKLFHKGDVSPTQINQYMGWYNNATKGKYGSFNKKEINSWCWKNKLQRIYPDVMTKKEEMEHFENIINENMEDLGKLKTDVISLLLQKRKNDAMAEMDIYFRKNNYIYSTRDDEKSEMWIYKDGIYIPQGKTYIKEFVKEVCAEGYTRDIANEIIAKIEVDTYIETDEFFKVNDIYKIPVLNGILDIKTRVLEPFSPTYRFFNKINAEYIPNATCPKILEFLKGTINEDDIKIIQELIGYILLKDYRIPKAFMFTGTGRNGKSRILELIKKFVGINNCINIPLQELCNSNARFSTGELFNKMVCMSPDLSSEDLNRTGTFKSLCGEDMVTSDRKFKTRIKFTNYSKLIFSANEIPKTYDESEAFFSRWIIINFPYRFFSRMEIEEMKNNGEDTSNCKIADRKLMEKITSPEELNGLLIWGLDGLGRVLENGSFSYTKTASKIKDEYIRKSDSFGAFILDCIEADNESVTPKSEIRFKYDQYCKNNKLSKCNDKHIKQKLESAFSVYETKDADKNGIRVMCWGGIKFK